MKISFRAGLPGAGSGDARGEEGACASENKEGKIQTQWTEEQTNEMQQTRRAAEEWRCLTSLHQGAPCKEIERVRVNLWP